MKIFEIKKLDKLWSEAVKAKASFQCEYCYKRGIKAGGQTKLNACHVVGRRNRTTRWGCEIDGWWDLCGFCGCYTCHNIYDHHLYLHDDLINKVIGLERYQKIMNTSVPVDKTVTFDAVKLQLLKFIDT